MGSKKGYRLHIEAMDTEPTEHATMASVRAEIRDLARRYDRTIKEVTAMAYIVTEEEYQAALSEAQ